jgi:hypothetical protein
VSAGHSGGYPIVYRPVPAGTPRWGTAWKAATAKWYLRAMNIGASGSVMPNRWNYYDLDPTYRNAFGQPLMRLTFDYKENEHRISRHAAQVINTIATAMRPTLLTPLILSGAAVCHIDFRSWMYYSLVRKAWQWLLAFDDGVMGCGVPRTSVAYA